MVEIPKEKFPVFCYITNLQSKVIIDFGNNLIKLDKLLYEMKQIDNYHWEIDLIDRKKILELKDDKFYIND